MVTLCQVVLGLNAMGLLALLGVLIVFRKPLGVALAMAQAMMKPPAAAVPRGCSPGEEEGLPPPEEPPAEPSSPEEGSGAPRKRLTFCAGDDD